MTQHTPVMSEHRVPGEHLLQHLRFGARAVLRKPRGADRRLGPGLGLHQRRGQAEGRAHAPAGKRALRGRKQADAGDRRLRRSGEGLVLDGEDDARPSRHAGGARCAGQDPEGRGRRGRLRRRGGARPHEADLYARQRHRREGRRDRDAARPPGAPRRGTARHPRPRRRQVARSSARCTARRCSRAAASRSSTRRPPSAP